MCSAWTICIHIHVWCRTMKAWDLQLKLIKGIQQAPLSTAIALRLVRTKATLILPSGFGTWLRFIIAYWNNFCALSKLYCVELLLQLFFYEKIQFYLITIWFKTIILKYGLPIVAACKLSFKRRVDDMQLASTGELWVLIIWVYIY